MYVLKNPHSNHVDLEDPDHANFKLATSFKKEKYEDEGENNDYICLIEFDSSSVQNQFSIEEVLNSTFFYFNIDGDKFSRLIGTAYGRIVKFENDSLCKEKVFFGNKTVFESIWEEDSIE